MNRRTLLGRLALGAAAVLGAGMAKGAEASEAVAVDPGCGNCQTSFPSIAALDEHYERWHGIAPRMAKGAEASTAPSKFNADWEAGYLARQRIEKLLATPTTGNLWITATGVNRAWVFGNDPRTLHLAPGTFTVTEVNAWMAMSGATNLQGAGVDQTIIQGDDRMVVTGATGVMRVPDSPTFEAMRPPMELANHCLTCDWVGEWSADISDRTVSDGLAAYDDHARREHGGQWKRDTVWRRLLHEQSAGVPLDVVDRLWSAIGQDGG